MAIILIHLIIHFLQGIHDILVMVPKTDSPVCFPWYLYKNTHFQKSDVQSYYNLDLSVCLLYTLVFIDQSTKNLPGAIDALVRFLPPIANFKILK